eukprot:354480-Chlamydomonas_euryale.AAC.2
MGGRPADGRVLCAPAVCLDLQAARDAGGAGGERAGGDDAEPPAVRASAWRAHSVGTTQRPHALAKRACTERPHALSARMRECQQAHTSRTCQPPACAKCRHPHI